MMSGKRKYLLSKASYTLGGKKMHTALSKRKARIKINLVLVKFRATGVSLVCMDCVFINIHTALLCIQTTKLSPSGVLSFSEKVL